MRLSLLCASILIICISPLSRAESDGGDAFVNAYVIAQQAEKAEQAGKFKESLAKFQQAAKELDKISRDYPAWSPTIVKYRKERTAEGIVRVQGKVTHFGNNGPARGGDDGGTDPVTPPDGGALPTNGETLHFEGASPGGLPVPPIESATPTIESRGSRGKGARPPADDLSSEFQKVEQRLKAQEQELTQARSTIEKTEKDKREIARKLEEAEKGRREAEKKQEILDDRAAITEAALRTARNDSSASAELLAVRQKDYEDAKKQLAKAKIEAEADAEFRKGLKERYEAQLARISALTTERDEAKRQSANVPAKIEALQKQLEATKKEKDALALKLQGMESQLTEVSKQRDDALAQVTKLKEAQKQVDKLVSDNASLMAKLAEAQKTVAQFKTEGADKDRQIADLKKEVTSVKLELEKTKAQGAEYQKKMGDLQEKLEETAKQLAETKSENTESVAEKKKMQEENQLLRGIVLREQRKEADRQAMKKIVLGELNKLEINSRTLLKQIDFLSEPTLKLTAKERALFKKPELQVSDTEISIAITKDDAPTAEATPGAQTPAPAGPPAQALPAPQPNSEITVPDEPKPATPKASDSRHKKHSTPAPVQKVASAPAATPEPAAAPILDPAVATLPVNIPAPVPAPVPVPEPQKSAAAPNPGNDDSRKPLISLNPDAATTPLLEPSNTGSTSPLLAAKGTQAPPPPALPLPTEAEAKSDETQPLVTPQTAPNTANTPAVPAEFIPLAKQGKEQFERGQYLEAEKAYRKILAKSPRNLYTLSNLGVVLFRSGKFKLAEEMFNKAIAVAPEDGFSHCTLGIVYYQESKLDEAVNELTKALAINPKNPTAHNYLGITASQKGWPEAAQKELETAVSLDASYADAYFNLAVVFATQQPPNKEEARKYYKRAIELGAEADPALEQLIK